MAPTSCIAEPPRDQDLVVEPNLTGLEIRLIPGRRLLAEQVAKWHELQDSNPDLANPCFSPEFTQAVAAVREDVEVAILAQRGEIQAFFPFQRRFGGRGIPVGGVVSDYHGLVCRPGFGCDTRLLLKGCGLATWDFNRLLASQQCFASHHKLCEPSAIIDLSEGFEAYITERRAAGTRQIDQCIYMGRRLQREVGPLRFVAHSADKALLRRVLDWKSQQYQRSRWPDLFATRWGRGLAEVIHSIQRPKFSGMLSLLYAGGSLVAGHFGMRSATVWHYWFPAYDRAFAKYSPGLVLLFNMARQAENLDLRSIDVGTGITLYKRRLMNFSVPVAEGSIERPSCLWAMRSARRHFRALIKSCRAN
ncbi:MAG TPA: GNAT family N-acetyltransferase [Verrucomicrobiae bacterium]|nr:GNAT family N-acetyltransferase [Verrucomicrobiae bacterium]